MIGYPIQQELRSPCRRKTGGDPVTRIVWTRRPGVRQPDEARRPVYTQGGRRCASHRRWAFRQRRRVAAAVPSPEPRVILEIELMGLAA
jgi:carbamate kinase